MGSESGHVLEQTFLSKRTPNAGLHPGTVPRSCFLRNRVWQRGAFHRAQQHSVGRMMMAHRHELQRQRREQVDYELWVFDKCRWLHHAIIGAWLILTTLDVLFDIGLAVNLVDVLTTACLIAAREAAHHSLRKEFALQVSTAVYLTSGFLAITFGSASALYLVSPSTEIDILLVNILVNGMISLCMSLLCTTFAMSRWLALLLMSTYQGNLFLLLLSFNERLHSDAISVGSRKGSSIAVLMMGTVSSAVIYFSFDWHLRTTYKATVQAAKAQAEIAGYVFHELRNSLCAMQGVFDVLSEQQLPDAASQQMLHEAHLQSRHAVQVVNNILDYSKLRVGELVLTFETPFALDSEAAEVVELLSPLIRSKPEVELKCHVPK
eukprot:2114326-Prymnesium_polylepis.1